MAARSLNKVLLIGNLTRDPELRYTQRGTAVCTFGLATNRSWVPAEGGERQEEAEFHRLVAWGKLAEICSQLLYKGRRIYAEGRLQTRKWQGQDGQERTSTEVVIDNMIALGAPKGASGEAMEEEYGPTTEEPMGEAAPPTEEAPSVSPVSPELQQGEPETGSAVQPEEGAAPAGAPAPKGKKAQDKGKKATKKQETDEEIADDIPF